jgi:hypothetical protein
MNTLVYLSPPDHIRKQRRSPEKRVFSRGVMRIEYVYVRGSGLSLSPGFFALLAKK